MKKTERNKKGLAVDYILEIELEALDDRYSYQLYSYNLGNCYYICRVGKRWLGKKSTIPLMKKQEGNEVLNRRVSILDVLRKRRAKQLEAMNQPKELSQEDIERFGALTDVKAQESKEQLMKCLNVKL